MSTETPQQQDWSQVPKKIQEESPNLGEDASNIPRSAVGTVNKADEVVNQTGQTIGKISSAKNPRELAGNAVTATGEVVNTTGNILGDALLDDNHSEYTTESQTEKNKEQKKESKGGWLSGVTRPVGGIAKGLGGWGRKTTEQVGDQAAQTKSETNFDDLSENDKVEDQQNITLENNDEDTLDRSAADDDETVGGVAEGVSNNQTEDTNKLSEHEPVDKAADVSEDVEASSTTEGIESQVENSSEDAGQVPKDTVAETDVTEEEKATKKDLPEDENISSKDVTDNNDTLNDNDVADTTDKLPDLSILKGTKVNKGGNLVNEEGRIIGRITSGEVKHLLGKTSDEKGQIWDDSGNVIGQAETIPEDERDDVNKISAPFENFPGAIVEADGKVMHEGKQVGIVIEGDAKKLKGSKVDEDGEILDRRGNVVGKAQAWDEPEEEPEVETDYSSLAGKRVNKAGNVVSSSGEIYGKVVEGNIKSMIGRMCDKKGNILSESGDAIGRAELVAEGEREGSKEGPFAELSGLTVSKDGKVVTPSGDVVGRLTSGDGKKLFGRSVDEDGDVVDSNGNVLAKAERWEEPEPEEQKKGPMAGRKINRDGNVVDEDGNIIGKLISGDIGICAGKEIDNDGDVINSKGNTIGHANLIEDIPPQEEPEPQESEEDKKKREQAEQDKELAGRLAASVEQSLDKIRPICKRITQKVDKAESTPKDELDEEQLVKEIKPLLEDGNKILTETNGVVRGMDPDGRIQRNAKHKSSMHDASPEEHHLAEVIKELTGTVSECIDNGKRKIEGMPHAKKELDPLWGLLAEPLGQILAAVGLLLNGVLGLVGKLLSGLGLGGLVDNLLGSLGISNILNGLGLGDAIGSLTGKKK